MISRFEVKILSLLFYWLLTQTIHVEVHTLIRSIFGQIYLTMSITKIEREEANRYSCRILFIHLKVTVLGVR